MEQQEAEEKYEDIIECSSFKGIYLEGVKDLHQIMLLFESIPFYFRFTNNCFLLNILQEADIQGYIHHNLKSSTILAFPLNKIEYISIINKNSPFINEEYEEMKDNF